MTSKFLRTHLIIALLGLITLMILRKNDEAFDFISGAALSGINITMLIWAAGRTLNEKGVALTLLAGVGKYFVLLVVFMAATLGYWNPTGFFVIGIISVAITVSVFSFNIRGAIDGSL